MRVAWVMVGARRLDGGVRREVVSTGPATRGVESGAAESDRADTAERAGAVGVSGPEVEVAPIACQTAAREGQAGEGPARGAAARGESFVAAVWDGGGAKVLARSQGKRTGGAAGVAGLRSASATLRPPCVPQPQPGKECNEQQPKKGTFSRELYK